MDTTKKIGKLTKKVILQPTDALIERNNKPCKDFHLKIFQRKDDATRVDFVYFPPEKYEKTVEKLQNTAQIEQFYEILEKRGDDKPCEISKFIFKTLYSTLDKEELHILKQSRKTNLRKKKKNKGLEKYLNALDFFLKKKQAQDKKKQDYKRTHGLRLVGLSKEEKREKIKRFKPLCYKCKKRGGNIFINKGGKLEIKCGSSENPCNLKFNFDKPKIINLKQEIDGLFVLINKVKENIIKSKLDFLFKLKTEETVSERFNSLKEEYNNLNAKLISYQLQLEDQTNIQERDEQIQIENIKLQEMVKLYSDNIKEYTSTNEKESLTEAIKTYINEIFPILQKKRGLKYRLMETKLHRAGDNRWLINFEAEQFTNISGGELGKKYLIQKRNRPTDLEYVISK